MVEKKKTEEVSINKPHDKGYKRDLGNPNEFLHFLKKYVNAEWTKNLRVSQLRLCDKEFVTKDYEGNEADLIYEITLNSKDKIYVFILQELQSYVDHTMIFRIMVYIMDILLRYFMATDKKEREKAGFRLPAVVPIVFYNGLDKWTAVRNFRDYQAEGQLFGDYILNLEYYLVDLNEIDENYILATNTVLDNIMYCDKLRQKVEIADAVRKAFQRVSQLGKQSEEEFGNWVKNILLSICDNRESVVMEILEWARNGDDDMAFKYNIVRIFEDEKAEGRATGLAEGRATGLAEGRATGLAEGRAAGLSDGKLLTLISQLRKKYQKGNTISEAADALEEDEAVIQPLYALIAEHSEDKDDDILSKYKSLNDVNTK